MTNQSPQPHRFGVAAIADGGRRKIVAAFSGFAWRRVWLFLVFGVLAGASSSPLPAQRPGTPPPFDAMRQNGLLRDGTDQRDGSAGLSVEAFVFQNEAGDPIVRPGMTWEDYERILRLQDGQGTASGVHSNFSLSVRGAAADHKATFRVTILVDVDSTEGRWVSTPLRMKNFHPVDEIKIAKQRLGSDAARQRPPGQETGGREPAAKPKEPPDADQDDGNSEDEAAVTEQEADEPDPGDPADEEDEEETGEEDTDNEDTGEFSGGENLHRVSTAPDGSGFVLWSRTTRPARLKVEIPMVALVSHEGGKSRVDFDLPDVSSTVALDVPGTDLSAQVIGRGDEVISQTPVSESAERPLTLLGVESAGGAFTLEWAAETRGPATEMFLDAQAAVDMTWDSPQDPPTMTTVLTVRNLRGNLSSFAIDLPPGTVLRDTPTTNPRLESVDVTFPDENVFDGDPRGSEKSNDEAAQGDARAKDGSAQRRVQVTIPEGERLTSMDVTVSLQVQNLAADDQNPLMLKIPQLVDAIGQRGELRVRCGEDYRLRWLSRPWVQSVIGRNGDEASSERTYFFDFDRGTMTLPVWLAAKQRQLRLSSEIELSLHDSALSAVMTVRPRGQLIDGRGLKVDLNGWSVRAITDLETGVALESFREGSVREIEVGQFGDGGPAAFQILAEHDLVAGQAAIDVQVPRVVEFDDSTLISDATVRIVGDGRNVLVVDLENSVGLDRLSGGTRGGSIRGAAPGGTALSGSSSDSFGGPLQSQYVILPTGEPTRLVGAIIKQPQRVTFVSDAKVELDGNELQVTIDWTVTSQYDLEGRLPIRILARTRRGSSVGSATASPTGVDPGLGADPDGGEDLVAEMVPDDLGDAAELEVSDWSVSVDGMAAILRPLGGDRYELVSDQLNAGSRSIRWRYSQTIRETAGSATRDARADRPGRAAESSPGDDADIQIVPLPRPDTSEVRLRDARRILLLGDQTTDLVSVDQAGKSQLEFDSPPREPLRLQLRTKAQRLSGTLVRRALIRTFIGRSVRHEQIFAVVEGGDSFQLRLPAGIESLSATAVVDGEPVEPRRRGDVMEVSLSPLTPNHSVEVKLWVDVPDAGMFGTVRPLTRITMGVERIYWQVITPRDQHLVWASPTIGRAMSWQFDRWRLTRQPTESNQSLATWVGATGLERPEVGNQYLYVGTSVPAFAVLAVSRVWMWLLIGSMVLGATAVLTRFPRSRHPVLGVLAAILLAGLLLVAPDAAVLAGQWLIVSLTLVVVMVAVRSLMTERRASRVLTSRGSSPRRTTGSTHDLRGVDSAAGQRGPQAGVAPRPAATPRPATTLRPVESLAANQAQQEQSDHSRGDRRRDPTDVDDPIGISPRRSGERLSERGPSPSIASRAGDSGLESTQSILATQDEDSNPGEFPGGVRERGRLETGGRDAGDSEPVDDDPSRRPRR